MTLIITKPGNLSSYRKMQIIVPPHLAYKYKMYNNMSLQYHKYGTSSEEPNCFTLRLGFLYQQRLKFWMETRDFCIFFRKFGQKKIVIRSSHVKSFVPCLSHVKPQTNLHLNSRNHSNKVFVWT